MCRELWIKSRAEATEATGATEACALLLFDLLNLRPGQSPLPVPIVSAREGGEVDVLCIGGNKIAMWIFKTTEKVSEY